jgi:hypothetical protein
MTGIRGRMYARAAARYQAATAKLKPAEDGSFDQDEVADKMADMVAIDVRVMQVRQAMQDLRLLRGDDDDCNDDGETSLQLNLFGEGRLVDYDPYRLVLGPRNRVIVHHLATLEYKEEERNRATLNRQRAEDKEARKAREVHVFARWSSEQLMNGRNPLELTWGNCVHETGILRERPGEAA